MPSWSLDSLYSPAVFVPRRALTMWADAAGKRAATRSARQRPGDAGHAPCLTLHRRGLDILTCGSHHPDVVASAFTPLEQALRALLHQSPRALGKDTSLWTVELAAEAAYKQGLTAPRVSDEAIRRAMLACAGSGARRGSLAPDLEDAQKSQARPPDPAGPAASRPAPFRGQRVLESAHLPSLAWQDDGYPWSCKRSSWERGRSLALLAHPNA